MSITKVCKVPRLRKGGPDQLLNLEFGIQSGFHPSHQTVDQSFTLAGHLKVSKAFDHPVYMCFGEGPLGCTMWGVLWESEVLQKQEPETSFISKAAGLSLKKVYRFHISLFRDGFEHDARG